MSGVFAQIFGPLFADTETHFEMYKVDNADTVSERVYVMLHGGMFTCLCDIGECVGNLCRDLLAHDS